MVKVVRLLSAILSLEGITASKKKKLVRKDYLKCNYSNVRMQFQIRQCPLEQVKHAKNMFITTSIRNSQLKYKMSSDKTQ